MRYKKALKMNKDGKAKVKTSCHVIPIVADGALPSREIASRDVRSALALGEIWNSPIMRGFQLVDHFELAVTIDGLDEEIRTDVYKNPSKDYRFADSVMSREDFASVGEDKLGEDEKRWILDCSSQRAIIYTCGRAFLHLSNEEMKDTILIDRQGNQLWPALPTNESKLKHRP